MLQLPKEIQEAPWTLATLKQMLKTPIRASFQSTTCQCRHPEIQENSREEKAFAVHSRRSQWTR